MDALDQIKQLFIAQRFQDAMMACKAYLTRQPGDANGWYLLAMSLDRMGQAGTALEAMQKAQAAAPDYLPFKRELMRIAVANQNRPLVVTTLESIAPSERVATDWVALGQIAWAAGQYDAAITHFETAWRMEVAVETGVRLSQSYYQLGKVDQGVAILQEAIVALDDDPNLLFYLGLGEYHRIGPEAGLRRFERVLALQPDHVMALVARYLVREQLGLPGSDERMIMKLRASSPRIAAFIRSAELFGSVESSGASACMLSVPVLDIAIGEAKQGTWLECGVYWGRSLRHIAAATRETVHGFDSFQGLPEDWKEGEGKGSYSTHGQLPEVPSNVVLHAGWFEQTLPDFLSYPREPIALLHIDCDIYSSTKTILDELDELIQPGSVIVLDDYMGYPGFEEHEYKAFHEYCERQNIGFEYLAYSLMGREVAVRITSR